MLPMPEVSRSPRPNPGIRGVVRARSQTFPLVSIRTLFQCKSAEEAAQELIDMLQVRRADHERWLDELQASIREGRAFTLATDPHRCGFGRWYDHFSTDDPMLAAHMRRFDEPHKAIHALAGQVIAQAASGDRDGALRAIDVARGRVLAKLIQLFHAADAQVRQAYQEIAILIATPGARPFAIAVDAVDTLVEVGADCIEEATGADEVIGLEAYAHLEDEETILVLDPTTIAQSVGVGIQVA